MKYIVTGANGFIGSYLCKFLLNQGKEVTGISRKFLPGVSSSLRGANLIEMDILANEMNQLRLEGDILIHLATPNEIISKDIRKALELSVIGTLNTLKLAEKNKIGKYIFFSTRQVYGNELSGSYNEQTPVKPEDDYPLNHLFGELYVESFSRKSGLKTLVVRPSNVYGCPLTKEINRWNLIPGSFCKEGVEKGTITLLSSGKQRRNFISLEHISQATVQAASQMKNGFDILNFVSSEYLSMIQIAELTQQIFKNKFDQQVELLIKNDHPLKGESFSISLEKLHQWNINTTPLEGHRMENEIENIIGLLKHHAL